MPKPIAELRQLGNAQKSAEMAAYHKVERIYLGVSNPQIDSLCKVWRKLPLQEKVTVAKALWKSNIHEAMVAAAKLVSQPRVKPDNTLWKELLSWPKDFDAWAIADHASKAISLRLMADPNRLDEVETWTKSKSMWIRRAALVSTLPWARMKEPSLLERQTRQRILGWAALYVDDQEWFIQKSVSWWLRELSKRDPESSRKFLSIYGHKMKAFARKDASKFL